MAMLHEDMELILDISKRTGGPEDYISELTDYFSDRPNIRKGLAPKTRLNEFVRLIAISQLESNKLSNMIDDVENGEAKVVQIAIVSPSKTGGKIYDTLEEQKKSNNEDITNFLNASDVAQA